MQYEVASRREPSIYEGQAINEANETEEDEPMYQVQHQVSHQKHSAYSERSQGGMEQDNVVDNIKRRLNQIEAI